MVYVYVYGRFRACVYVVEVGVSSMYVVRRCGCAFVGLYERVCVYVGGLCACLIRCTCRCMCVKASKNVRTVFATYFA